jgi:hypothetical protein
MSLRREPYKAQTEAISVRAHTLMQRINKMFTGSRQSIGAITASATSQYGDYFVVDLVATNGIYVERKNISLEGYDRELGLLKPFERLEG